MIDPTKRKILEDLINELDEKQLAELRGEMLSLRADALECELVVDPDSPVTVTVEGNGQAVRFSYNRTLNAVVMPNAQAVEFAMLILQSCGASIDRTVWTSTPAPGNVA
jgi:hypothetical protein